jgi:hypothetical protein
VGIGSGLGTLTFCENGAPYLSACLSAVVCPGPIFGHVVSLLIHRRKFEII